MRAKVGVNGFGRIGRLAVRELIENAASCKVVHINDVCALESAAYLLKFDSVHGTWAADVEVRDQTLVVKLNGTATIISYTDIADPSKCVWASKGIDIVMEASGKFLDRAALQPYFDQQVKKVIVAAPVKDKDPVLNIVIGCNEDKYDPHVDHIITAASCTTNCLAPVVRVIHEKFGIVHGCITTIHNITNTQTVVDAPNAKKSDLRRARSGLVNLAPTSTGSASAISLIYPELQGKLNGLAVRVPLTNSSITDCVFEIQRRTTPDEVNALVQEAAETYLKGILGYEERPLVSTDFVNDRRSSIVDALSTQVIDGTMVKIYAWYDNEFGYAMRYCDLAPEPSRTFQLPKLRDLPTLAALLAFSKSQFPDSERLQETPKRIICAATKARGETILCEKRMKSSLPSSTIARDDLLESLRQCLQEKHHANVLMPGRNAKHPDGQSFKGPMHAHKDGNWSWERADKEDWKNADMVRLLLKDLNVPDLDGLTFVLQHFP